MRVLVILAALGLAGWGLTVMGSKMSESDVRDFYAAQREAVLKLDADAVCDMLAEDFSGKVTTYVLSYERRDVANKDTSCNNVRQSLSQVEQMQSMLGNDGTFDYTYDIKKITLSEDRKTATVDVRSVMRLPGAVVTSRQVDTVVRRQFRMFATGSEGKSWMGRDEG